MNVSCNDVANEILCKLQHLGAWVYHKSKYNSIYIKFKDENLRSVRIGDHTGREKYRYKWNIWVSGGDTKVEKDRGITRFHYQHQDLEEFIKRINQYSNTINRRNG